MTSQDLLMEQIVAIVTSSASAHDQLQAICQLLQEQIPYYDWVGFYLVEPGTNMLVLGPFVGEPTEHTRIPFGRGICGQAAERKSTFVVQDVAAQTNYLSCSTKVRSEIVVPIVRDGEVLGELDIDSHTPSPFTPADEVLLERVCAMLPAQLLSAAHRPA
jgi:L-methionine (R)-S-oxide reductase